jgi:hypothetical protein
MIRLAAPTPYKQEVTGSSPVPPIGEIPANGCVLLRTGVLTHDMTVNGHLFLPTRGHRFSPVVAIECPHSWPSFLPTWLGSRGLGQGPHPLAGGRLREPVAVLAVGDDYVRVMEQPVDGCGRHRLGHQFVEPGRVNV